MPIFLLLMGAMATMLAAKDPKWHDKFLEVQKKMNDVNREIEKRKALRSDSTKRVKKASVVECYLRLGEKADRADFENEALKERVKFLQNANSELIRGISAEVEERHALEKDLATAKAAVLEHTQTIVTTQRRATSSVREVSALRKLVRIFFDEREAEGVRPQGDS